MEFRLCTESSFVKDYYKDFPIMNWLVEFAYEEMLLLCIVFSQQFFHGCLYNNFKYPSERKSQSCDKSFYGYIRLQSIKYVVESVFK